MARSRSPTRGGSATRPKTCSRKAKTRAPMPCVVDGGMIFANDCCRLPCAPDRSFRRVERRGSSAWGLNSSIRKQLSQSYTSNARFNEYRSEPGIDARHLVHDEV